GRRVADEHQIDAGGVHDPPAGMVVGGDHHDRAAVHLHLPQLGERDLHGSTSTMLSISLVAPKRAAATRRAPARGSVGSNVSGSTTSKYSTSPSTSDLSPAVSARCREAARPRCSGSR